MLSLSLRRTILLLARAGLWWRYRARIMILLKYRAVSVVIELAACVLTAFLLFEEVHFSSI